MKKILNFGFDLGMFMYLRAIVPCKIVLFFFDTKYWSNQQKIRFTQYIHFTIAVIPLIILFCLLVKACIEKLFLSF